MANSWIEKNKKDIQKVITVKEENDDLYLYVNFSLSSQAIEEFLNLYIEELVDEGIGVYKDNVIIVLNENIQMLDDDFLGLLNISNINAKIITEKKDNKMVVVTEDGTKITLNNDGTWEEYIDNIDFSDTNDLFDGFDDTALEDEVLINPWDNIEEIAEIAYYGLNDELVDYEKAYQYYMNAYNMGSPTACRMIAHMHGYEGGAREDPSLALKFLKEGIVRKDLLCWIHIADIYKESNISNSMKAIKKYLNALSDNELKYAEEYEITLRWAMLYQILSFENFKAEVTNKNQFDEILALIKPHKNALLIAMQGQYENYISVGYTDLAKLALSDIKNIEKNW